jgi:ubiquinone/menaquinone biosynthesis C-methylase UbiE
LLEALRTHKVALKRAAGLAEPDWDRRVDTWERVAASPAFATMADRVVSVADPRPDDRVVDLGAGTGLLALRLAPLVESVVAVDASEPMLTRLRQRAAQVENVRTACADFRTLPLEDGAATLVVSNYAFHHVDDAAKELALAEARRVLAPGGRLVVCDMMFALTLDPRDRQLIVGKVLTILRRGPAGVWRLARNAARVASGRWEHPTPASAWREMLERRGFEDVSVELLEHEGGIATARRPAA